MGVFRRGLVWYIDIMTNLAKDIRKQFLQIREWLKKFWRRKRQK